MKHFKLALLLAATLLVSACAAPAKHSVHQRLSTAQNSPKKVLLMPADVVVKEISAGGLAEKVDDWTKQAAANVNTGVRRYVEQKGRLQVMPMPTLSAEEQAKLDQHIALYDVVGSDAFLFGKSADPAWAHKRTQFDYTLGDGLAFLKQKSGADAAIFVTGVDHVSSSGRKAAFVVGALLGVGIPLGSSLLHVGVVDLATGDLLWTNYDASYAGKDLREAKDAEAMVFEIFKDYPGLAAQQNAE